MKDSGRSRNDNLKKSENGFTLLELLLVLALIGVVMWAAVINFTRIEENSSFKSSLRSVQGGLRQARMIALSERVPVSFVAEGASFHLLVNGEQRGKKFVFPRRVKVKAEEEISFYPKGNSSGGKVILTAPDGKEYQILVDGLTGVAKLEK
jgi:general secretion pathway protein H